MTAAMKVPHPHAEVIRAWADGAQIEWRYGCNKWSQCDSDPAWDLSNEYRIKPEPPAKVYPVTGMADGELCSAVPTMRKVSPRPSDCEQFIVDGFRSLANAALRHAIDAGQIITTDDHRDEIAKTYGTRDKAVRAAVLRMEIAEAVRSECQRAARLRFAHKAEDDIRCLDLAAIIAKVLPC